MADLEVEMGRIWVRRGRVEARFLDRERFVPSPARWLCEISRFQDKLVKGTTSSVVEGQPWAIASPQR